MKIALSVIGALCLAVVITVFSMDWLIISVNESGPDGTRVWIPVPMAAIHLALWAVPDKVFDEAETDAPEFAEYHDAFRALAAELVKMPDAVIVEVTEGAEHVVIRKEAELFVIDVTDGLDEVSVRIPAVALTVVADAYDGRRFDLEKLAAIVGELPDGEFIHVSESDTNVTLAIW